MIFNNKKIALIILFLTSNTFIYSMEIMLKEANTNHASCVPAIFSLYVNDTMVEDIPCLHSNGFQSPFLRTSKKGPLSSEHPKRNCFYVTDDNRLIAQGGFVAHVAREFGVQKKWQKACADHMTRKTLKNGQVSQPFLDAVKHIRNDVQKQFTSISAKSALRSCIAVDAYAKHETEEDIWNRIGESIIREKLSEDNVRNMFKTYKERGQMLQFLQSAFLQEDVDVSEIKEYENIITLLSSNTEEHFLHSVIEKQPEAILGLLDKLPVQYVYNALGVADDDGNTPLLLFAQKSDVLSDEDFIAGFKSMITIREDIISKMNKDSQNIFHILVEKNPYIIPAVIREFPEKHLKETLNAGTRQHEYPTILENPYFSTPIVELARHAKVLDEDFRFILGAMVKAGANMRVDTRSWRRENNIFDFVIKNRPKCIPYIIDIFPKEKVSATLCPRKGHSLFDDSLLKEFVSKYTSPYSKILSDEDFIAIFECLVIATSESRQKEGVIASESTRWGSAVHSIASDRPHLIPDILKVCPEQLKDQIKEVLNAKTNRGDVPLRNLVEGAKRNDLSDELFLAGFKAMIKYGADLTQTDKDGKNIFHLVAEWNPKLIPDLLHACPKNLKEQVKQALMYKKPSSLMSPWMAFVMHSHMLSVEIFESGMKAMIAFEIDITQLCYFNGPSIFLLAAFYNPKRIPSLIHMYPKQKLQNDLNQKGWSAWDSVETAPLLEFVAYSKDLSNEDFVAIFNSMEKAGADVTTTNEHGGTIFHLLAQKNPQYIRCIASLPIFADIKEGESVGEVLLNKNAYGRGNTPLIDFVEDHAAKMAEEDFLFHFNNIIDAGADITKPNGDGETIFHSLARVKPNLIASIRRIYPQESVLEVLNQPKEHKKGGNTPLLDFIEEHAAKVAEEEFIVHFNGIVDVGADIAKRNGDGETVFHLLSKKNIKCLPDIILLYPEYVYLLLQLDKQGYIPLKQMYCSDDISGQTFGRIVELIDTQKLNQQKWFTQSRRCVCDGDS